MSRKSDRYVSTRNVDGSGNARKYGGDPVGQPQERPARLMIPLLDARRSGQNAVDAQAKVLRVVQYCRAATGADRHAKYSSTIIQFISLIRICKLIH